MNPQVHIPKPWPQILGLYPWCQVGAYQRADGAIARRGEEGDEGGQCCADAPGGLPVLGVVRGDGQADLGVGLKAAVGREHQEAGRLEGVLWREQDAPMVDATLQVAPVPYLP